MPGKAIIVPSSFFSQPQRVIYHSLEPYSHPLHLCFPAAPVIFLFFVAARHAAAAAEPKDRGIFENSRRLHRAKKNRLRCERHFGARGGRTNTRFHFLQLQKYKKRRMLGSVGCLWPMAEFTQPSRSLFLVCLYISILLIPKNVMSQKSSNLIAAQKYVYEPIKSRCTAVGPPRESGQSPRCSGGAINGARFDEMRN